jgi:diadenosine tetraphosphate (Ap4A) HIT family hydrolase
MSCVFCSLDCSVYLAQNEHFFAIPDKYPVGKGHCLIISRRHIPDYFALSQEESKSLQEICCSLKELLDKRYSPAGYNLAMIVVLLPDKAFPIFTCMSSPVLPKTG